jgi:hypothetical protein
MTTLYLFREGKLLTQDDWTFVGPPYRPHYKRPVPVGDALLFDKVFENPDGKLQYGYALTPREALLNALERLDLRLEGLQGKVKDCEQEIQEAQTLLTILSKG